jgi:hypothetical protein
MPQKSDGAGLGTDATKSTTTTVADILNSSADRWHSTPTPEERAVKAALEVLQEFGYGIAMRCLDCQHPITSVSSLRRMRGPRCAARHHADEVTP